MAERRDRDWIGLTPLGFVPDSFKFRSGEEARTLDKLVQLCDTHWDEAKQHLYDDAIEAWLKQQGLMELAAQALEIKSRVSDQNIGLEAFLEATEKVPLPTFTVDNSTLRIRKAPGERAQATLTITNAGRGYLSGTIAPAGTSPLRVSVTPRTFSGNRVQVAVTVSNFEALTPGQYVESLQINTAAGASSVQLVVEKRAPEPLPEPEPPASVTPSPATVALALFALFLDRKSVV